MKQFVLGISTCLTLIFSGCGLPTGKSELLENLYIRDSLLLAQLSGYPDFTRAGPFWSGQALPPDSASWYYGRLLSQPLNPGQRLVVLNRLGYLNSSTGQYDRAIEFYRMAFSLLDSVPAEHFDIVGLAGFSIGLVYSRMSMPDSALFFLKQSGEILLTGRFPNPSMAYACQKQVAYEYCWVLEDFEQGGEAFIQARRMLEGGEIPNLKKELILLSYSQASLYRRKREYAKAVVFGADALKLAGEQGEQRELENCHALLANLHRDQNQLGQAREHILEAIRLNISNGGTAIDRSAYYGNLAYIELDLGNPAEAAKQVRQAIQTIEDTLVRCGYHPELLRRAGDRKELVRASVGHSEPMLLLESVEQLGICEDIQAALCEMAGQPAEAVSHYRESRRLNHVRFGNHHKMVAQANLDLARFFLKENQPDSALRYYQAALISGSRGLEGRGDAGDLPNLAQIDKNVEMVEILREKSSLLMVLRNRRPQDYWLGRQALSCLKLCDSLIGHLWESFTEEADRLFLEREAHPIYGQAIATAAELYREGPSAAGLADIFTFMENGRYRLLLNQLGTLRAIRFRNLGEEKFRELRENELMIRFFNRMITEYPDDDGEYIKKLIERIHLKERLAAELESANPGLSNIRNALAFLPLDSVNARLGRAGSWLIQFFEGNEQIHILFTDGYQSGVNVVKRD
ncbi:MAG: hypothetical protein R6V75_10475, partial [Bacteroidales bacterium]